MIETRAHKAMKKFLKIKPGISKVQHGRIRHASIAYETNEHDPEIWRADREHPTDSLHDEVGTSIVISLNP